MNTNFKKVCDFNISFGLPHKNSPDPLIIDNDPKLTNLRVNLCIEEIDELKEAFEQKNFIEIIDALTDELYVLYGSELGSRDKKVLTDFGKDHSLKLNLISMVNFIPKNLPIKEGYHLTESAYYRLFCHKALPNNIKSALYLDCDMLAIGNIGELLSTELSFPIGAVDHLDPFNQLRINN